MNYHISSDGPPSDSFIKTPQTDFNTASTSFTSSDATKNPPYNHDTFLGENFFQQVFVSTYPNLKSSYEAPIQTPFLATPLLL